MKTHEHRPQQLNKQTASAGTLEERDAAGDDDDELMLNVLRCHLTY